MQERPAINGLTLQEDVTAANWIVNAVDNFTYTVGSLIPNQFEAYARVFNPAYIESKAGMTKVRWSTVSLKNGRHAHPGMEWVAITGSWRYLRSEAQPGIWDKAPAIGSLPEEESCRLAVILNNFTATPKNCWFAVWEGYGELAIPREGVPRVELPHRNMLLLSGAVSEIATSLETPPWDQRANLWWPGDHSWCVATDIDLMTSYVGGSSDCIESIVNADGLEAMRVSADQRFTWDSDLLNPTPAPPETYGMKRTSR